MASSQGQSSPSPRDAALARLFHEAEEAWSDQEYDKSIRLLEQARREDPSDPAMVLNLARAHGLRYDYATAERFLEEAVRMSRDRATALGDAGRCCLEFEHVDMAIRYLQRASGEKGASIGALVTLSDVLIRERRPDEAAEMVAHAARIDPKDPRVRLEEATLQRHAGKTDAAESIFRSLLADRSSGVAVQIRASYELAGILDRSARYDEAMSVLLEIKAIQRKEAGPYAATLRHMQSRANEMEQTITAPVLARWRAEAANLHPPRRIALLCGHPRSGTTLLEQVLDAHPDIISAEETKLMHDEAYLPLVKDFPEGTGVLAALDATPPSLLRHARENYFRCIDRATQQSIGERLLIDKNPGLNFMIPMVVRVFPEAKFLVALRDPRDVILSCFMQALPMTPISSAYLTLDTAVRQYAAAMGFWLAMRPRIGEGTWMQVRYERLVDDLPRVAHDVLDFLGVAFDERVLTPHEHARTKRVKSPSHADVIKPTYRTAVGRWRHYEKHLHPYLGGLNPFLTDFGYV
jgi:Flp pilus assembly protein TadD